MPGYSGSKDDYAKRMRRIEGQVRGVQRMIELASKAGLTSLAANPDRRTDRP